jgi:hypothetical protein
MDLLQSFKRSVSPQLFTRTMLGISALWLFVVFPGLNWICPDRLHKPSNACDFQQYYAGATVVKNGLWDSLYPVPKPEVYHNPPTFRPKYRTFLFDEQTMGRKPLYYPALNVPEASDYAPKLLAICPELTYWRFINPPPLVLLLWPLSLFDYETAAHRVFPTVSMAALFGLSIFSSRIYRLLRGCGSYSEGLVLFAVAWFSFRGRTSILSDGNVTPILGFLIAFATYAWMRGRQIGVGVAMIPLLLFKTIGLTWCPLLLLRRVQWKTLGTLAGLSVLLNGLTLYLGGVEIYRKFFFEVVPRLYVPIGVGFTAEVFRAYGFYPGTFYSLVTLAFCGLLYWGYWRGLGIEEVIYRRAAIAATLAGTMAMFCLLNFSIWLHYFPSYLYFPFLGWLLWEGHQATGRWRVAIFWGLGLGFLFAGCEWIVRIPFIYGAGSEGYDLYIAWFMQPFFTVFGPIFFLIVAFRRLFFAPPPALRG